MDSNPVKVGLIGCGVISEVYGQNCKLAKSVELVACADLIPERAEVRAAQLGIRACPVDELLADPEIELVLNLTIPKAHAEVTLRALEAGKSVFSEKPLAIERADARRILDLARAKGLHVGCAPDTFLGGGLQTCRKLIDDGWIGEPIAATAFMINHGHESWHPDPEFFYQHGGGPMLDVGPYYITALLHLLGPIRRVTGSARITFPERTITSRAKYGSKIKVQVPTHVTGVVDFASGAIGTVITSFDIWAAELPRIEVYGSEGTLSVPDPNNFAGPVRVRRAGAAEWSELPLTRGNVKNCRGLGLADMATALRTGRPYRASGELAYHALDVMLAFGEASETGRHVEIASTCGRPAPLPLGLPEWTFDR